MAHRQESVTHERSSGRADPRKFLPGWSERVFRDQESALEQALFGQVQGLAGLSPILEATDDGRALVLQGPVGADQSRLAQIIHQRHAGKQGLCLRINAASRSSLAFGRDIVARFRDLALDSNVESFRSGVTASTIFVEKAQLLDEASLYDFARLADLRREGRVSPRLILGFSSEVPPLLADIRRLEIPALRMRPGDVTTLAREFCEDRMDAPRIGQEGMEVLKGYDWPGNEAELHACLENLANRFSGRDVGTDEVNQLLSPSGSAPRADQCLAEIEEQQIYRVLAAHEWNRTRSAQILGIDVKTLYNKLKRYESRKRRLERARADA